MLQFMSNDGEYEDRDYKTIPRTYSSLLLCGTMKLFDKWYTMNLVIGCIGRPKVVHSVTVVESDDAQPAHRDPHHDTQSFLFPIQYRCMNNGSRTVLTFITTQTTFSTNDNCGPK